MRIKIHILFVLLGALLLSGCISEYTPKNIENAEGILVVEGIISEGETLIKLSTSVGIQSQGLTHRPVTEARLEIESNDGTIFYPEKISADGYQFSIDYLDENKEYRLTIDYDGNRYESSFLTPIVSPEIDEVYYIKEKRGDPVKICLSTHNDRETSSYYLWSYREDWEFTAELEATHKITYDEETDESIITPYDLTTSDNIYYCFGRDFSKSFILGSTSKLSSNLIKDQILLEADPTSNRWQSLYRITVKQNAIRKEAHDYFLNLRKNAEGTGSLFAPIPSEMNGNIKCITDPDIPAIGYVDVSSTAKLTQYFSRDDLLYEYPLFLDCDYTISSTEADSLGYEFYKLVIGSFGEKFYYYALRTCFDCTRRGGNGKNRPDNWPTDHY